MKEKNECEQMYLRRAFLALVLTLQQTDLLGVMLQRQWKQSSERRRTMLCYSNGSRRSAGESGTLHD